MCRITNSVVALLTLLAVCSPCTAVQQWDCPVGPNLVRNPSFEEVEQGKPSDWRAPNGYGIDTETSRSGQHSLRYSNDDPERYLLCTQQIDLKPGSMYEVQAYVRTAGVAGRDSGALVCVEWTDDDGKWMGGHYPEGRRADAPGWHELRGVFQVPEGAAHATISCYLRKGATGTAWWEDVSVRLWRQRPLDVLLISPNYRGLIFDGGPSCVEMRVDVGALDPGYGKVGLVARLTSDEREEVIAHQVVVDPTEGPMDLRLPVPELAPGSYWLRTTLLHRATGETLDEVVQGIERREGRRPTCYIDQHNRVILEGEPFFPLGMFWSRVSEEELRAYTEGPFNCLMPYGSMDREKMDLIEKAGLKIIFSIKDDYYDTTWCPDFIQSEADEGGAVRRQVQAFRDHPALLAWYLNDERPLSMLPRLEAHQRWVEEEDPNHPTWTVLYQVDEVRKYTRSFDVIGTDPYPIPDHGPSQAGEWTRKTREAVSDARSIWMVPQVFRRRGKERPPTLAELRSMAWQCIAEGADGLVFYSWFELRNDQQYPFAERWEEVKTVAREINEMVPVLLSIDPVPEIVVCAPEAVHWTTRAHDGGLYLFLVNDSESPVTASIRLPDWPGRVTLGDRDVSVDADGVLTVEMEPLGVQICRVEG